MLTVMKPLFKNINNLIIFFFPYQDVILGFFLHPVSLTLVVTENCPDDESNDEKCVWDDRLVLVLCPASHAAV